MNLQAAIDLNCVIVKQGGQYCVKSEDRSKNLGCKPSKEGAKKRLQQVEYFKHMKGGGPGSGRHKGDISKRFPGLSESQTKRLHERGTDYRKGKKKEKKWKNMSEEERRSAAFHDPRQMTLPLKAKHG